MIKYFKNEARNILKFFTLSIFFYLSTASHAQTIQTKISGYFGIVHPIVTFSLQHNHKFLKTTTSLASRQALIFGKIKTLVFSFEVVPYIKAANGTSKMSSLLFHPGLLFPIGKGTVTAARMAFETSGSYGFTPVLNKVIKKNKNSNVFIALPLPLRFGNNSPATFTIAFQLGISF